MQESGDLIGDGVFHPDRTLSGSADALEQVLDRKGSPENASRAQLESAERLDLGHFVNPQYGRSLRHPKLQFSQQAEGTAQTTGLVDEDHLGMGGGNRLNSLRRIGRGSDES